MRTGTWGEKQGEQVNGKIKKMRTGTRGEKQGERVNGKLKKRE
jgi:hypothetical protein